MTRPAGTAWYLTIDRRDQGPDVSLALSGRLGRAGTVDLAAILDTLIDNGRGKVVLDMTGVDYISSAALLLLESASTRFHARDRELVVCGVQGPVKLAFDLAGPLGHVATVPTPSTSPAG
jgi:stage II sporulation protein AA (anti-sigma F factor antagonist)